jgi:hypothetical protein
MSHADLVDQHGTQYLPLGGRSMTGWPVASMTQSSQFPPERNISGSPLALRSGLDHGVVFSRARVPRPVLRRETRGKAGSNPPLTRHGQ